MQERAEYTKLMMEDPNGAAAEMCVALQYFEVHVKRFSRRGDAMRLLDRKRSAREKICRANPAH